MKLHRACATTLLLIATLLAFGSAYSQQRRTVEGVEIDIGIVNSLMAQHVDSQHGVHQGGHGPGMQHVVVSLGEAKAGKRIAGAGVAIELKDPKGRIQRKSLMPMTTAGVPDYSEVFDFGWSGKYDLRVTVMSKETARPVSARFTVNHYIP